MILAISRMLGRLRHDDEGAVVIDYIPVFAGLIVLVLFTFEVGVAYFLSLRAYKAAQLGARVAAIMPSVHDDVPRTNGRVNPDGRFGEPCFNAIPGGTDRCFAGEVGPWICAGAALDAACDGNVFNLIVNDMRRTFGNLTPEAVTITYVYRQLGETGGPFIPEVNVAIAAHDYELSLFSLGTRAEGGIFNRSGPTRFGAVSSSAFGENTSGQTIPVAPEGAGPSLGL